MMTLVRNELTTPISHPPLPQREIGPGPVDQNPRHRAAHRATPVVCPADQNTRHRTAHRATLAVGQTAPVPPDSAHTAPPPPPHCHPLPDGTLIVARHAPYSKTWDAAVVVSSRQRHGRTLYDVAWEDTSSGATSGAIPQTRVQPSPRPPAPCLALGSPRGMASSTGAASRGPEPSPAPDPPPPPPPLTQPCPGGGLVPATTGPTTPPRAGPPGPSQARPPWRMVRCDHCKLSGPEYESHVHREMG